MASRDFIDLYYNKVLNRLLAVHFLSRQRAKKTDNASSFQQLFSHSRSFGSIQFLIMNNQTYDVNYSKFMNTFMSAMGRWFITSDKARVFMQTWTVDVKTKSKAGSINNKLDKIVEQMISSPEKFDLTEITDADMQQFVSMATIGLDSPIMNILVTKANIAGLRSDNNMDKEENLWKKIKILVKDEDLQLAHAMYLLEFLYVVLPSSNFNLTKDETLASNTLDQFKKKIVSILEQECHPFIKPIATEFMESLVMDARTKDRSFPTRKASVDSDEESVAGLSRNQTNISQRNVFSLKDTLDALTKAIEMNPNKNANVGERTTSLALLFKTLTETLRYQLALLIVWIAIVKDESKNELDSETISNDIADALSAADQDYPRPESLQELVRFGNVFEVDTVKSYIGLLWKKLRENN